MIGLIRYVAERLRRAAYVVDLHAISLETRLEPRRTYPMEAFRCARCASLSQVVVVWGQSVGGECRSCERSWSRGPEVPHG